MRALINYNTEFTEQTKSSAGTDQAKAATPDQYRDWANQVKDYASAISNPDLAGKADTAADVAGGWRTWFRGTAPIPTTRPSPGITRASGSSTATPSAGWSTRASGGLEALIHSPDSSTGCSGPFGLMVTFHRIRT